MVIQHYKDSFLDHYADLQSYRPITPAYLIGLEAGKTIEDLHRCLSPAPSYGHGFIFDKTKIAGICKVLAESTCSITVQASTGEIDVGAVSFEAQSSGNLTHLLVGYISPIALELGKDIKTNSPPSFEADESSGAKSNMICAGFKILLDLGETL